jgi:hypothetical protein
MRCDTDNKEVVRSMGWLWDGMKWDKGKIEKKNSKKKKWNKYKSQQQQRPTDFDSFDLTG